VTESGVGLLSAIAAVVSAATSLFAAWAAYSSAKSSAAASRHAEQVHRQAMLRELLAHANAVVSETLRAQAAVANLSRSYDELFTHAGQSNGSRKDALVAAAQSKLRRLHEPQNEARQVIEKPDTLRAASDDDIANALHRIEGMRIHVTRVREELDQESAEVVRENDNYRRSAIERHGK
jgi:hypothetical protein